MRQVRQTVPPGAPGWPGRRTGTADEWTAPGLLPAKGDTTVSVVLPAHDERETVGAIVATVRDELVDRVPLVDEVIVVDSRSTDDTAAVAAAAGARVVSQDRMTQDLPRMAGKGDALWSGLAAASGDVVAFVDADLREFSPHFVVGLLGPLLTDPTVAFVKGFYHRPLIGTSGVERDGGGRVTELAARPMLNLFWPELSGFIQPLAGEYAGRRAVLERVPFVSGYGVETALLIDLLDLVGLDALAQVDLGERLHRHQDTEALGRMSAQIMLTAWSRLHRQGRVSSPAPPTSLLTQFRRVPGGGGPDGLRREVVVTDVAVQERPPLLEVADLMRRRRDEVASWA
ncbi:glucosyl-3-phosphoglycerate synthase [Micromonospora zhanjiangensis]|uniref:Glucosyl-3-phosphoglycerate synthase n=1 Tax=Micromonospora zhanjiangensis TaxID=1522057 RepID=A0ABV8KTL2_9ACTN